MTNPQKAKGDNAEREIATIINALTDECLLWPHARNGAGYGNIRLGGRKGHNVKAHRLAFEMTHGPIPPGMVICHRCDNPPCINPRHLFMGTTLDNVRDKVAKGRQPRGETNGAARLNEAAVKAIRLRQASGETRRHIAAQLGVSETTVGRVVNGQLWGHVA